MNPDISTRPTFANMLLLEARNFMACGLLIFNIVAFQRMRLSQCNPFASVNKKKSPPRIREWNPGYLGDQVVLTVMTQ